MKRGSIIFAALLSGGLLAAILTFFYPEISDQISRYQQGNVITEYNAGVAALSDERSREMLEEAEQYNRSLDFSVERAEMTEDEREVYNTLLDTNGSGVMGYIRIPKIDVNLPIYHGTSDEVLQDAIGHLEGTSLPVGGVGTHAVISGHRGLPTARLFTDIEQLEIGDRFQLRVLGRSLTYEVDRIRTVLPEEVEELRIDPEKDQCTLITCTPYGVNTHRLLVRGVRVPGEEQDEETGIKQKINPRLLIPLTLTPVLLVLLLFLLFHAGAGKRKEKTEEDNNEK